MPEENFRHLVIALMLGLAVFMMWAVGAFGEEVDIDRLVPCVIQAESNGNPNAINRTSWAKGIMQITPIVVKEYLKYAKIIDSRALSHFGTNDFLYNAEINQIIGTWYLNRLKDHYLKGGGSLEDILICWNWGYGNWRKWNKNFKHLPKETQNFIKKVRGCYK